MAVGVERDTDACVPKSFLHDLRMRILAEQQRRGRVPLMPISA